MSLTGIGSSINGYSIGQMMSRMQTSVSSSDGGTKEKPDLSQLVSQLDADSSGSLDTTDEIQSLADAINRASGVSNELNDFLSTYDTNEDGSLSEEEAVSALEANPPQGPPPPPPGGMGGPNESDMVNAADTNEDGIIDEDEAASLVEIINNATGSDLSVEDFLNDYETDDVAGLSTDEAIAAMEANRPEGPPPPGGMGSSFEEELVSSLDESGDGAISAEEAAGLVDFINNATGSSLTAEDFVSDYDSDGDGVFSTEEAVAAMEENRPDGAPPPPPEDQGMTAAALETYATMSLLGSQNTGDILTMMMGNSQESIDRTA